MNVPLEQARLDLSQALLSANIQLVGIGYGTKEVASRLASVHEQALAHDAREPHQTLQAVASTAGTLAECIRSLPDRRAPVPCSAEKDEYLQCSQAAMEELARKAKDDN